MINSELGKLKRVEDLRQVWEHEAADFTRWLSESENLDLLSEEIGIELSLIEIENQVGDFSVDIFAEEENTGRKVIIENQLERTDHDHLGKIITYASGLDAEVIIWIVKEVRDEHKKAIDWLNEQTGTGINFFAIRLELWQVNNSVLAPKFNLVAAPNNWAKSVKGITQSRELSEIKLLQKQFWEELAVFVEHSDYSIRLQKPNPQHWMNISLGRSDCNLSLTLNSRTQEIGCEVYISDSIETFEKFKLSKSMVEQELGNLLWMPLPNRKASRIKKVQSLDFTEQKNWQDCFEWLAAAASSFKKVFAKL